MRGKMADMENKILSYEGRLNSFNQENEDLKASNEKVQKSMAKACEENLQLKQQLG